MPRRTASDAAVTRSDILRAARKLFATKGYAATTTGEIAKAAGVTAGALFHHFDGKVGLFRSVFESLEVELDASVRDAAGEPAGGAAVLDAFLEGFRAYLEFAKRRDFHRIVMLEGPAVLGEAEWHAIEVRRGAGILLEGLDALVAEGVIEDRPRRPLALLLLGAMTEAGFEVARGGSRKDVDALVDAMRYLLTSHLAKGAKPVAAATPRARRKR